MFVYNIHNDKKKSQNRKMEKQTKGWVLRWWNKNKSSFLRNHNTTQEGVCLVLGMENQQKKTAFEFQRKWIWDLSETSEQQQHPHKKIYKS